MKVARAALLMLALSIGALGVVYVAMPARVASGMSAVFTADAHSFDQGKPAQVNAPAKRASGDCLGEEQWSSTKAYQADQYAGKLVARLGKLYKVNFYSVGLPPESNSAPNGQPWIYEKDCAAPPDEGNPPTVIISGPTTAESEDSVTLDATGSSSNNPGAGELTYNWVLPDGIAFRNVSGGTLSFVAPHVTSSKDFQFVVRVSDGVSSASNAHVLTVKPKQGGGGDCAAPQYEKGISYTDGNQVKNHGELYTCKQAGWCSQAAYAPGEDNHGDIIWPLAWTHDGRCEENTTNTLMLEFPPKPDGLPGNQPPLTGVLRCGAQETPIQGIWGEKLLIKDLKLCKYQLSMNMASSGHLPVNMPKVIDFKSETGEFQTEKIQYGQPIDLAQLRGLPGIKIELFAVGLNQPRQMAMGNGVLYVGSSMMLYASPDDISRYLYALPLDASGKPRGVYVMASDLEEPHGVAYRHGDLYFSTTGTLYRIRDVDTKYIDPTPEKVLSFPADQSNHPATEKQRVWHQKHPLRFNPLDPSDPWLYTTDGRPCNTCMIPAEPRYGTLMRYNVQTGDGEIIANGVRNSVGFDWNPKNGDIWWSDNNRQNFANGDEINRLPKPVAGAAIPHFGAPYVYANGIKGFTEQEWLNPTDAIQYSKPGVILSDLSLAQIDVSHYQAPAFVMADNLAPLGVKFWSGYPASTAGTQHILFTTHGLGMNKEGLEVRMLTVDDNNKVLAETPLITGWLGSEQGGVDCAVRCVGRPVEFLELADHSLLISDDIRGVIYRVHYDGSGLPDTTLAIHAPVAPDHAVADQMVSGVLTEKATGHARRFYLAWGSQALQFKGFAPGEYDVRLNDIGNWVPQHRVQSVHVTAGSPVTISADYKPFDPNVRGTIRVRAPVKPNAALASETLEVKLVSRRAGEPTQTIAVPWGQEGSVQTPYGEYDLLYPFVSPSLLPDPSKETVWLDEGEDDVAKTMHYERVDALGPAILSRTCASCHDDGYFNDPAKAHSWHEAGAGKLAAKIMSMPIPDGHCDQVCGDAVAQYLFDDVWRDYLNPGAAVGVRQLRLLTPNEYAATVKDMLNVDITADKLPSDKSEPKFRYPGQASRGQVGTEDVMRYYQAAQEIAPKVDLASLGYADTGGNNQAFIEGLGRRLYRRRLQANEVTRLQAYLNEHGPQALVAAMLDSPYFLYRSELGEPQTRNYGGTYALTHAEIASVLSYGFLGTAPSLALQDKAEAGELDTPSLMEAEVTRMLQSPAGQGQFARFIRYYTKTTGTVGAKNFPALDIALDAPTIEAMRHEQDDFSKNLIAKDSATVEEMFNPGYTYLNGRLAEHYGIGGVSGDAMQKVTVPAVRGGLLHMGIVHVSVSADSTTSLVRRGRMIRENLFCRDIGAATGVDPDDIQLPSEPISTRQFWDLATGEHASGGQCWSCHNFMNNAGAALEHYGPDGRYRQQELSYQAQKLMNPNGDKLQIDANGNLVDNTGSNDWTHMDDGARSLAENIPRNPSALRCLSSSYYRMVMGIDPAPSATATVGDMTKELTQSGRLHGMISVFLESDALRYRRNNGGE
ncbi:DUF1592 domain-containing protein [Dyella tabacisoli]|uniref:DUF1592 domain-containing protein n=1 Tax=Dyella tabacisoli TaxID=2282381 RepID=A0A369UJB0_9GAMM|nr:DUF1592 domain-containing protein [Dyella tabacisoli]RDD80433.1 DUF1592 domain-containing protein [Dyella tabacisoli]